MPKPKKRYDSYGSKWLHVPKVETPLALFALIAVVIEACFATMAFMGNETAQTAAVYGFVVVLGLIVLATAPVMWNSLWRRHSTSGSVPVHLTTAQVSILKYLDGICRNGRRPTTNEVVQYAVEKECDGRDDRTAGEDHALARGVIYALQFLHVLKAIEQSDGCISITSSGRKLVDYSYDTDLPFGRWRDINWEFPLAEEGGRI